MPCNKKTKRCEVTNENIIKGYILPVCCRQNLMNILTALPKIMEGSHWWLDFGTLLGFYRDGRIIDCDTDIDISVLEETFNREQFFSNCKKLKFYIKEEDKTRNLIRIYYSKKNLLHTDVWIWRKRGNKIERNISVRWNSNKYKKIPKAYLTNSVISNKYILALDSLNIEEVDYPIPHEVEEYLELWYADWKEKVNKYDWLKQTGYMK